MSIEFGLGEVQTVEATRWQRHAVAMDNARPDGWAQAACPAAPRVWVHQVAGAHIPFPGLLDTATACPDCLKLAASHRDS